MKVITAAVLSVLFCTVVSSSLKVKEEHKTAFFGEDIHIDVPPGNLGEVVFKSRINKTSEVVLLREGRVVNPRSSLNSLGHLVLEDVQEEDEGLYIIKNINNNTLKHLILVVRDCAVEQVVKYGDPYVIHLNHVAGPITLEFRPSPVQHTNHTVIQQTTEPPAVMLYNQVAVAEEYVGRLKVSEKKVTLHAVTMADEGSFTVLDREGKVRRRNCLNIREHQVFLSHLTHGGNVKIKLYLQHSDVSVVYRPKSDNQNRVILDQGVLMTPLDPQLEGRLTVEGSEIIMKKLHTADTGVFQVTDLAGFPVAYVYIQVDAYKLPPLTVAILAMMSLIAVMLLVCLLSCLYKVHKRNEKTKKLMLIAQQAGKGDGEAFRQVVHDAYTRFTEESLMQSICEKPSEATEVTIKGLEVSKPGRYQALNSDSNFLEMSDSGVEFTISGLPLDSDTDAAMTYASHKPLLNAVSPTAVTEADSPETTVVPDDNLSPVQAPDSAMSAMSAMSGSPASNPRSLAAATPDGSPRIAASPGAASRGTTGSDSAKTEGGADSGEAGEKEEPAQSI